MQTMACSLRSQQVSGKAGVGAPSLAPCAPATFACLWNIWGTDHVLNERWKRHKIFVKFVVFKATLYDLNQKAALKTKLGKN